jgi:hypothetical protein
MVVHLQGNDEINDVKEDAMKTYMRPLSTYSYPNVTDEENTYSAGLYAALGVIAHDALLTNHGQPPTTQLEVEADPPQRGTVSNIYAAMQLL